MGVSRRRLFGVLAAGGTAAAQAPPIGPDIVRQLAAAQGLALSPERARVLQPILERRQAGLRALRDFAVDDRVEPAHGIR
jgi:hypothetical protein